MHKELLTNTINASTIIPVEYKWNDIKRANNLAKHQLDFADAEMVLDNLFRLDVSSVRNNETRMQSFAFVFRQLTVLTVVHLYHQLSPCQQG